MKFVYDMDYVYTVQGSTLQGDPLGSSRGLHWNCFGVQATNLSGMNHYPGITSKQAE